MVFFTCDSCGESLKKAQVEKHLLRCHSCCVLSCIDCGKDFRGDAYKSHIKCISEDQKYGGRGFQARASKGDAKQQQWIQRVQDALQQPGVDPKLKQVLQQISSYENVPRKRAKFENWMRNCLKISAPRTLQQLWETLSSDDHLKEPANSSTEASHEEQKNGEKKRSSVDENGAVNDQKKKRRKEENAEEKSNKRQKKRNEECDESQNQQGEEQESREEEKPYQSAGKFNWKGSIKALLREGPEDGLTVKKLRKKVLSAYHSVSGERNFRSDEELLSIFNKKINSNPKFRLLKGRVKLVNL